MLHDLPIFKEEIPLLRRRYIGSCSLGGLDNLLGAWEGDLRDVLAALHESAEPHLVNYQFSLRSSGMNPVYSQKEGMIVLDGEVAEFPSRVLEEFKDNFRTLRDGSYPSSIDATVSVVALPYNFKWHKRAS